MSSQDAFLLGIVGGFTLLIAAVLLDRLRAHPTDRSGRGWDRFDPSQKLFVAAAAALLVLVLVRVFTIE